MSGQFSGENFNSSANQEWLGNKLANTALPYYSQAYQTERQNQLNALQLAPSLQQANYQQLLGAGGLQEQRGQAEIQAAQQQYNAPWDLLNKYGSVLGAINTPNSGTTSSTQPSYYDPLGAGLGGALGGYQLGQNIQGLFSSGYPQSSQTGFPSSGNDYGGVYDPGYGYASSSYFG